MKKEKSSAWRFLNSHLDVKSSDFSGLTISNKGGIDTVSGHESVKQALFLLLSTSPGERVMRPRYGCELNRLVFSPNNDTTAGLAIHYVKQAIHRWEPRIIMLNVDANRHEEGRLNIELNYRIAASNYEDSLIYRFNLNGGFD